jgi:hypothetical protein
LQCLGIKIESLGDSVRILGAFGVTENLRNEYDVELKLSVLEDFWINTYIK